MSWFGDNKKKSKKSSKKNPFYLGTATKNINDRKYQQYKTMVETGGGKNIPLSYNQWKKAGRPVE